MLGNKKPLVSILCPTFNHARYINDYIRSVLAQTNTNWELLIVDDCSTDNNVNEIKKYTDPRIKLIQHPFNMGINCALNSAFKNSVGEYVAFCAGDDILLPNYVDNLITAMHKNPDIGVIYSDLQCMDVDGIEIPGMIISGWQKSRYELLNTMFFNANCVPSPGMAIRRSVFEKIAPLDIPMSQYQDYKMHVDLLLRTDCMFEKNISFMYRVSSKTSGISYETHASKVRMKLEENLLMDSFLQIKDTETLSLIFTDKLTDYETITPRAIPYILGSLALRYGENDSKKLWGYNQIVKFISVPSNYEYLNKLYNFTYKDFLDIANYFHKPIAEHKYKKYKKLFNYSVSLSVALLIIIIFLIIF